MHLFHHRPLAFAACLYVLGAVLALKLSGTAHLVLLIISGCLLVGLAGFFCFEKTIGKRGICACLCLVALVASLGTSYRFFKIRYANLQDRVGETCTVEGSVIERLSGDSFYSNFRVEIDRLNGEEASFGARLECSYSSPLQLGDRFVAQVVPRTFTNDEYFDEESYSLSDGCLLVLVSQDSDGCTVVGREDATLSVWASKTNMKLSQDLYQATKGGLVPRLLLGNGSFLSEIDQLRFSYTGTSHLLALSGLHVSILIGFLELILRRLRVPRMVKAFLVPTAAIGYLILTGSPVSAIRAVLMVCILYLAYLWRGEYDPFTALSLALVLILQISPYAVYDLSLWLSFAAAGSIVIYMPLIRKWMEAWKEKTKLPRPVFGILRRFITAISVGVIVNIALLPLSAVIFGEISLWSVPVTLLFSIPVALILILGILCLLFPFVPYLPELCGTVESWMLATVQAISELEHGLLPLGDTGCGIVLALLVLALILLAVLPVKRMIWWLSVPVLCVAVIGSSFMGGYASGRQEWNKSVLEYSQGEVCIYTKEGRAVVVNHTVGALNPAYEIKTCVNDRMGTEIDSLIFEEFYAQSPYFFSKLSERIFVRALHLPIPKNAHESAIAKRIGIDAERYGTDVLFDAEEQLSKYEKDEK